MVFSFSGIFAHFIDKDWTLRQILVDFNHLENDEHTGIGSAVRFAQTVHSKGGLDKMSTFLYTDRVRPVLTFTVPLSAVNG